MAPKKPAPAPKVKPPLPGERDEPVKLPIDFEDALRGLLAVDPDSPPKE